MIFLAFFFRLITPHFDVAHTLVVSSFSYAFHDAGRLMLRRATSLFFFITPLFACRRARYYVSCNAKCVPMEMGHLLSLLALFFFFFFRTMMFAFSFASHATYDAIC